MKKVQVNELRHFSRKLVRELGMLELNKTRSNRTPQHWHALIEIHNEPNITTTKLGGLLLLTNSTISRIVGSLVKEGLVTSTPGIDKRENFLQITEDGLSEINYIDHFSNTKILGALEFLTKTEQVEIVEAIKKYSGALEKSRILRNQVKIHTLSTSRSLRKQIINMIENIQKNEFAIPITSDINACILKAETEFYYHNSYNFWYAVNDEGQIIGSIGLKKLNNEQAEIKKFFVHHQYRGKKVSQKLMKNLLKATVKHQFKELFLGTVDTLLAAQRFYEKCGFNLIRKESLPKEFVLCPLDNVFFKAKSSDLLKIFSECG
ncbi:bifunctional helix-turn-helix transcriptional regulator/GNAT family N-acetyltransferase [Legionella micdadei]|uniref:HTH transcriptional regulator, MarR n=1 Tax=Legionella micdadei TaxID=451 RepID=A0A098GGV2_LEGMI|nr:bifunctional helix-turn-helix transcriptional regulator/GNAT family N-acetyltransferase [Legionella micdadei]ARG97702.1 GNAT family N-acetyltransferase [Legionella micdadei]ARG99984.1 GNAT family N-acetyltransferase [Legionella micdadei]KTD27797.1 IAA acetyltransferase/MarR transcriptional regulatory protein [Legionella micdadei]CEG60716.1 HTH transcriptional regulator, MarR [Legionella micdadei]SCY10934.1 transcriptional regulator, MarR family with acetyltransferase activity [Legionella mi